MSEQLTLFDLHPRDEGLERVASRIGGIRSLHIERFKAFRDFRIDFEQTTLIVGSNSSGKTSILQALRLFYWCIQVCGRREGGRAVFRKAVMPFSEFRLIPAHDLRELVFQGITPNKKDIGIVLTGALESGSVFAFRIYAAYSILMAVEPISPTPSSLPLELLDALLRPPLYIPGFFGVVNKELFAVDARLEELLSSGHHNEVLRNLLLRLRSDAVRIDRLRRLLQAEFGITNLDVPFSQKNTEYLRGAYAEPFTRISLDFVSAGSGFLQVLQVLTHALQNPSPILLLDEPDAHMHCGLQRSFLSMLQKFATDDDLQVVMASHSETFLRQTPLEAIRVIDSQQRSAVKFENAALLQSALSEAGIWPDHAELAEILRTRRVCLVEGREDELHLDLLGRIVSQGWDARRKLLQVVLTDGSTDVTVSRLEYVHSILARVLPSGIKIVHFRDRDLLTDEHLRSLEAGAREKGLNVFVSERRNREAFLVEPQLVERALQRSLADRLPRSLKEPGAIATVAMDAIVEWCEEQIDVLPEKVREYNLAWMRKVAAGDQDVFREMQARVGAYLRLEWNGKLARKEIPWKLVDGKEVIGRIRAKLQPLGVQYSDGILQDAMVAEEYGQALRQVVDLVLVWTEQP